MATAQDKWFDILIIGSGTAGAVLAGRLAADPALKVGLIEAGGAATHPLIAEPTKWPLLQGSDIDWGYRTLPQQHTAGRVHDWPRGRVIGGSTAINAMAHVRGHPSDFDRWAAEGCAGWGFADLFPYFVKSETYTAGADPYHGQNGPLHLIRPTEPNPVTRAYMAAGMERGREPTPDHNGARMDGPCLNTLTIKDGKRQTIADAYLTPVLGRKNLTILQTVEITELVVEKNRVTGVRAGDTVYFADKIVLATGAIGSPLLLMRSGIGPADELKALGLSVRLDVPAVGRNLHDHLLSGGNVYRSKKPVPPSRYQNSESLMYLHRAGADRATAPEMVLACVVAPVITEQFQAPPLGEAYTLMFGFTHPKSRGSIRLASADPKVMPLINPNYLAESYDREAYLEALDTARDIGAARAFDDWRAEEVLPGPACTSRADKLAFLEKAAFTHHHPVGTCRMGSDSAAVVDTALAVRGIQGLYICDASVIPTITTGPVNAAIVAMAERFADLLAGQPVLPPARPSI
ncbi:GMC family oxidoreductase [Dongia sp.]|uniref:GMC family oxidoreductase n=1 Tax=Dongia sp. TaxID=1977262 RepID=UPI0035AF696C